MVFDINKASQEVNGSNGHTNGEVDDHGPGGKFGYRIGHSKNGYTVPDYVLNDPVNRKVKVLTIGAGVSGIMLAYFIQKYNENVEHVIYEKNGAVTHKGVEALLFDDSLVPTTVSLALLPSFHTSKPLPERIFQGFRTSRFQHFRRFNRRLLARG